MTDEQAKAPERKVSGRALQIRQTARKTATGEGKDWAAMPKEERQVYKTAARESLKSAGLLLKRDDEPPARVKPAKAPKQPREPKQPRTPKKALKI